MGKGDVGIAYIFHQTMIGISSVCNVQSFHYQRIEIVGTTSAQRNVQQLNSPFNRPPPNAMKPFLLGFALLCLASLAGSAAAATNITILDFSFETPANTTVSGNTTLGTKTGTVGNWNYSFTTLSTGASPASIKFGTSSSPAPTQGLQIATLSAPTKNGITNTVKMSESLTTTLVARTTYTLTFDISASSSLLAALSGASVSILAGTTVEATLSDHALLSQISSSTSFSTVSLTYTTGATAPSGDLGMQFYLYNGTNVSGASLYLDNSRLSSSSAAVPEGGSGIVLLGLGLAALCSPLRGPFKRMRNQSRQ